MGDIANTLAIKRWWQFRQNKSVWADFLKAKYCPRMHPVGKKWQPGNSQAWKHLLWARDKSEYCIQWNINSGSCSFWWDNWTKTGPLAHTWSSFINKNNYRAKVQDFIVNQRWNAHKIYKAIPSQLALHIMSIEIGNEDTEDYAIWSPTEDGNYSNSSSWNLIRKNRYVDNFINKIWHKAIPFKMPFICWRMFSSKLPFPRAWNNANASTQDRIYCVCCHDPQLESMQYVMVEGKAADCLWKAMGGPLGLIHQHSPIRSIFSNWWNTKPENKIHILMLQATPVLICWEIWKSWTSCKYGDKNKFYHYKMVNQLLMRRGQMYAKKVESLRHKIRCNPVHWEKPATGMVKLNTDGSFFTNTRKAGIGGVVRDEARDLIFAFSVLVNCSSNNQAEAAAVNYGINW
ncbi:uncharacterized protein LOC132062076 [Lycium ferocissimum]|uniref:uncharacterized protein LOC132062076 n=1 Tax=Lycium ferocissimum TaxID=112874 RepID=UPI0028163296|nr:uncharacterized protein LOC132062076 [Lycium ferocissimum]